MDQSIKAIQLVRLTTNGEHLQVCDHSIIYFYPAGDIDLIPWPLESDEDKGKLARALYDEVEMGFLPSNTRSVLLPDGEVFEISEANMSLYKPPSMEGLWY